MGLGKGSIFISLSITTLVAIISLILAVTGWHSTNFLLDNLQSQRATIQLIVQLISTILGALQIYAIGCCLRYRLNTRLQTTPTSLNRIKAVSAFLAGSPDVSLPWHLVILLFAYLAASQIPAALWAGALTPVLSSATISSALNIPSFGRSSAPYWNQTCAPLADCGGLVTGTINELGVITYLPWKLKTGLLLNSIATASSRDSTLPQHTKIDSSGYTFQGRSYGIGSSIGATDIQADGDAIQPLSYNFTELGYMSSVNCIRNSSSQLYYWGPAVSAQFDSIPVQVYGLNGSLPNGNWSGYPVWGVNADTVLDIAALANDSRYIYGSITGNINLAPNLTGIQCEATFAPTQFQVSVNTTARNISVTPMPGIAEDIEPTGRIAYTAFMQLQYATQTLTTMYTSLIGDSFISNIDNVRARNSHSTILEEDILTSFAEGIEAVLDASLETFSLAQTIVPQDVQKVTADAQITVARLGKPIYAYLSFAVNLFILAGIVVEAVLTRFWRDLPRINCLDIKSAIIASGTGSLNLGEVAQSWNGEDANNQLGRIKVILEKDRPVFTEAFDAATDLGAYKMI